MFFSIDATSGDLCRFLPGGIIVFLLARKFIGLKYIFLLTSIILIGTEVLKARKTDLLDWKLRTDGINIIGHRGCATNAPENTIAAILEARNHNVKSVEVDLWLSSDGEPVIIHDSTLQRTTNGVGFVSEKTFVQLIELDASSKHQHAGKYPVQRIPHLREVLRVCKENEMTVFLDIYENRPIEIAKMLREMTEEFPDMHKWVIACSFHPSILYAVKWYMPQMSTILTYRSGIFTYTSSTEDTLRDSSLHFLLWAPIADFVHELAIYNFYWYFCGVNGVFVNADLISVREKRFWSSRGIDVFAWTVNDAETKKYLKYLNITFITDDVSS